MYSKKNQILFYREELFNSLCSNIDDIFIVYHLEKQEFEYISPNIERIFGISVKSFRDNPLGIIQYIDRECHDKIKSFFTTNFLNNYYEMEYEFRNIVTNQTNWVELRIYPVLNNLKTIRYICCVSDLTKRKQSQQILKNAFLNAQKANEAKKEFLSHMSHELRTPINAIIGMSQIASNSLEDDARVVNCLNKITTSSKHLLEIINNNLDMAKIDSDKLVLSKDTFQIINFSNSFVSILHTQAQMNQQDLDLVFTDIIDEYIIGDQLRLEQILCNCLSNSIKFTPPGGKIKLEISEIEKHCNKALFRFIVSDNGKGMNEDFIDKLFIPFEQEDSSIARKYGGSGLGMSITKNLVTLMGGNIKVASELGKGTTITIDIVFETPNNPAIEEMKPKTVKQIYDFTGHRILVVEDNEINLEITCELLKNVNVTVETAMNGYEALKLFQASPQGYYEIILMDVQMPGLNGYETTKVIRTLTHPDSDKVTIIAMSADTSVEDISLNLDYGMNYHIAKPIDIDYFNSLLSKVFSKEEAFH